jgi:predicted TIM-barrel fold metal-dependent hydrolase
VVGDISGFTLKHFEERFERFMLDQVREVVTYAGNPHSILYGTDWPISGMQSYLRFVEKLDLSDEERKLVLYENAVRVFHLDTSRISGS